jgi:hypothetical protein
MNNKKGCIMKMLLGTVCCVFFGSLLARDVYSQTYRGWIPICFCGKRAYVGFLQNENKTWGDMGPLDNKTHASCPTIFNPAGSYSITFVAVEYCEPEEFLAQNKLPNSKNFVWIPIQVLFNSLYSYKRLIRLSRNRIFLLDKKIYDALCTPESIDRLSQILPSFGGVCAIDICCIDR